MSKNQETQSGFKYVKLYDVLVNKITCGEWKPNECMPTERDLCRDYGISRITVRDTLKLLEKEGYIYRRQGKGTFVAVRPIEQKLTKLYTLRENIEAKGMIPRNKILSFKKVSPAGKVAKVLELDQEDWVYELIRCFYASDVPYAVETTYIPAAIYPELTEEAIQTNGLYKTMQSFNILPERAIENMTAVPVSREDAVLLNIKNSDLVIRDERTTFSKGLTIEYTITMIKSDFFCYTVELGV